jgi:hypothetical protein
MPETIEDLLTAIDKIRARSEEAKETSSDDRQESWNLILNSPFKVVIEYRQSLSYRNRDKLEDFLFDKILRSIRVKNTPTTIIRDRIGKISLTDTQKELILNKSKARRWLNLNEN